jgi:ribosomal protein S12 methylthiotransferase accessory factor YcaO
VTHAQAELKIAERLLQESIAARLEAEVEQRRALGKLEDTEKLFEARSEQARRARVDAEQRAKAAEERARTLEENLQTLRGALTRLLKEERGGQPQSIAAE